MSKRVQIIEDYCITCHLCEVACVVAHSLSKDPVKAYKRERPRALPRFLLVFEGSVSLPLICQHCEHAYCVDACISGALTKLTDGRVAFDESRCVGCASCVMTCPHGSVRMRKDIAHPKALKCDLCPDREVPACVQACQNRALLFVEDGKGTLQGWGGGWMEGWKGGRMGGTKEGDRAPYVIVGGGIAAAAAVKGIRRLDEVGDIFLICPDRIGCYSKALLSEYLLGEREEFLVYRHPSYFEEHGVKVLLGRRATAIDVNRRSVTLDDGMRLPYGSLLLCMGGKPFVPPMPGLDKQGVFTFTELSEAGALRDYLRQSRQVESAVVIGGGFIGLEVADCLQKMGKKVTVVELMPRILIRAIDSRGAQIVHDLMVQRGISFRTGDTVERIVGDRNVEGVVLKSGERIACEVVVIAIGVVPNTDLLCDTPIKVNRGVLVNERMETNVPNVYAAGDVVEALDISDGQRRPLALFPLANEQGEIAGINMAGGNRLYPGGLPMNSLKFLPVDVISGGLAFVEDGELEALVGGAGNYSSDGFYRKVLLQDGRLVGFVCMGEDVTGAGIYNGLIRARVDVSDFKEELVRPDFSLLHLPKSWRQERFANDRTISWNVATAQEMSKAGVVSW